MENINLEDVRNSIDQVDSELMKLLSKRFELTEKVGIYKAANNLMAQDTIRESEKFDKLILLSEKNGLNSEYALKIFRCIMDMAISRHQEIQGGIRGTETSNGQPDVGTGNLTPHS
ncbi:chorismate mutase [Niallia endozanthoxylica]|uniref:Chorismate mutase n=1 Tax=Niallia endozanthoxylica TaxID=2036016 RepID=A0A5J5I6L9_9BACI|nr:chorismate mutase [Niallia endozanthoxylica]KAA9032412.1 chorismate mutase [Niallia endozanthoxylica]